MDEFEPVKKRVYLRDVKPDDRELLFQWVNDREVRANSFRQEQVSYREHCCWMERVLSDPDELFFLVMDDGNPVGQLRLTKCGGCAEISYSIAPDKRGIGYGTAVIELAKEVVRNDHPDITRLIAKVKPNNVISSRCFEKNGFVGTFCQYEFAVRE